MLSLDEYIKRGIDVCDCHVHWFGRKGIASYTKPHEDMIVMVENNLKYQNDDLLPYFEDLFTRGIPKNSHLLGIGKDEEETEKIYWNYKDKLFGIGEVKAYKHYKNSDRIEKEHFNTGLLNWTTHYGLPIFVHWDLNGKHDKELYDIIKSNRNIPFILCHCGMNDIDDQKTAFNKSIELQTTLPNLWLDISWVALEYFSNHPTELARIEMPDHVLVGTDFSSNTKDFDKTYDLFRKIYTRFNVQSNLNNLQKSR